MKIPLSMREIYNNLLEINSRLKEKADEKIISFKESRWHYESRLKEQESFALKLETGRINNPKELEDFFAGTIVVENRSAVNKAENLIKSHFKLYERRPATDNRTDKNSYSFQFDDLRLYVRWEDDPVLPPTGLNDLLFEIQIKTFLQHAWAIATHDLVYKSDSISWATERIAYQIKAMLEHAEISILEAKTLADSQLLNKLNNNTIKLLDIIKILKILWRDEDLPKDVVRLARNVLTMIEHIHINTKRLHAILDIETKMGRGVKTLNLSPYGIIIQSLFNQETKNIINFLSCKKEKGFKMLIPKEIEISNEINKDLLKNAIFL